KRLYSSGWDGAVRRWDLETHKQLPLPAGIRGSSVCAASPDGRTVAYADDAGAIRLVDVKTSAELDKLDKEGQSFSQLLYSPDAQFLAGGGASGGNVHVTIWNLAEKKIVHRWEWPKGRDPHSTVESLCFTPDGKRLAAAVFRQSTAFIWDVESENQLAKM